MDVRRRKPDECGGSAPGRHRPGGASSRDRRARRRACAGGPGGPGGERSHSGGWLRISEAVFARAGSADHPARRAWRRPVRPRRRSPRGVVRRGERAGFPLSAREAVQAAAGPMLSSARPAEVFVDAPGEPVQFRQQLRQWSLRRARTAVGVRIFSLRARMYRRHRRHRLARRRTECQIRTSRYPGAGKRGAGHGWLLPTWRKGERLRDVPPDPLPAESRSPLWTARFLPGESVVVPGVVMLPLLRPAGTSACRWSNRGSAVPFRRLSGRPG